MSGMRKRTNSKGGGKKKQSEIPENDKEEFGKIVIDLALRAESAAIDQFYVRAHTLQKLGHSVDKIELLVSGGTFCQFPIDDQEEFMRDLFFAANTFYDGIEDFDKKRPRLSLNEEIKIHETATKCRIAGITLEMRPDSIKNYETIRRFRDYGATRLQVGAQHLDDAVLKKINRGCEHKDTIKAVRMLKNSGYQVDIHLMPSLPGSSPAKDRKMFEDALSSDLMECDQWKVYPREIDDSSKLLDVVIALKKKIHPWIRLDSSVDSKMDAVGYKSACIQSREIRKNAKLDSSQKIVLKRRFYQSSGGQEVFLSFETKDESKLLAFCRLRLSPLYVKPEHRDEFGLDEDELFLDAFELSECGKYGTEEEFKELVETFPELYQAALIREVRVYGSEFAGESSKSYGSRLVAEAEKIAMKRQYARVAVIAGVGTRMYYRTELGYRSGQSYMVKDLDQGIGKESVGKTHQSHWNLVKYWALNALLFCVCLYTIAYAFPLEVVLLGVTGLMLVLDYLHFCQVKYSKVQKSMLRTVNIGLFCTHLAIAFKWCSLMFPRVAPLKSILGSGDDCGCRAYWSASLLSYVSAFYLLKFLFFKKTILIIQNPIFGNDRGIKAIPKTIGRFLVGLAVAYAVCQYMMVDMTSSECTDKALTRYDASSPYQCHDRFEAIDAWFSVSAIVADFILFSAFCYQWYVVISVLMEEIAASFLIQFGFIVTVMVSNSINVLYHLSLLNGSNQEEFDSFVGTGYFCVDCAVLSTCLLSSLTDFQRLCAEKMNIKSLVKYYDNLETDGYAASLFG